MRLTKAQVRVLTNIACAHVCGREFPRESFCGTRETWTRLRTLGLIEFDRKMTSGRLTPKGEAMVHELDDEFLKLLIAKHGWRPQ